MTVTRPPSPLSGEDLRTLAAHTISCLPVRHGAWRITDTPEQHDGPAVAVEDEARRVLLATEGRDLTVRAWPLNGTTAPAATTVERWHATGRTIALAIARNHLGPQHPAPLNEAQREQQELRAATDIAARIPAGAAEAAVSRTDRWYTVSWSLGPKRRFRVRVDGPQRVQTEVSGLSLNALSVALGAALPHGTSAPHS